MTFTPDTGTIRAAYHLAAGTEATGLQTYEEVDAEFERWLALDRVATLTNLLSQMSSVMYENEYMTRAVPKAVLLEDITQLKKEGGLV